MSKKHCAPHPQRGSKPNHGRFEEMTSLDQLRKTQAARERQTGSPWPEPRTNDEARLKLIRGFRRVPEKLAA